MFIAKTFLAMVHDEASQRANATPPLPPLVPPPLRPLIGFQTPASIPLPISSPYWQSACDPPVPAFANLHYPVANIQAHDEGVPFAVMQSGDMHRGIQRLAPEQLPFNLGPCLTQDLSGAQTEASFSSSGKQQLYPPPLADHQDVVANRQLFFHTLAKFHALLGAQLVIPKIDGSDLDLHLMYSEVTAIGGLKQVIKLKQWDVINQKFGLATRVSCRPYFIRKHYSDLLYHYEQVYFFRCEGLLGPLPVPLPSPSHFNTEAAFSVGEDTKRAKRRKTSDPSEVLGGDAGKLVGQPVSGAIDGKLEHGYLVTVHVGAQCLRGILFHQPKASSTIQQLIAVSPEPASVTQALRPGLSSLQVGMPPLQKKKGKESKRDPNAPRISRSSYNFYFSEQRSLLKNSGSENAEITRIIGDSWQKLTDQERMPYLQRGLTDKERYKKEKKEYIERMKIHPQQRIELHGTGHGAEQDIGGFNGSEHDYHVSLDPDIEGGENNFDQDHNFRTPMHADNVSADELCHAEEQLPITLKYNGQLIHQDLSQIESLQKDNFAEDHTYDLQQHTQLNSENLANFQDGQFTLENPYRHIGEQADHGGEPQRYPRQQVDAGEPQPCPHHGETGNFVSRLFNNQAMGGDPELDSKAKEYAFPQKIYQNSGAWR